MTATSAVLNTDDVRRAIHRMAHEIVEHHRGASDLVLVGIHTRGVTVAAALAEAIGSFEGSDVAQGELDIGLYRDDLDRRSGTRLARTHIPVDIGGKPLVLVDDVLFTGRTIRAALDALVDLGRASTIQLAVLVDRGHRQLPIRPDYVGKNLPTAADERVTVQMRPVDAETGVWIEKVERT